MAKKRKLTPKLKQFLYDNRTKAKLSDYDGDALAYLKKLRAATKAAKTRKGKVAKIGGVTIPRNSELYETIEASARAKKVTVAQFIKKYKNEIKKLMVEERVVLSRETTYAIHDINSLPKSSKVYVNNEQVSKGEAIYALQAITSAGMQHTGTVVVNYEMEYDLLGNLYLTLPDLDEIENAIEEGEIDSDGQNEALMDLLESSDGLTVIDSPKKRKR